MKVTAINNQNRNLQKKIFITSVGLMSILTPLSATKKQNITNPVPQICNIKENDYITNSQFKDFFVSEELSKKESSVKKGEKPKDLNTFEKFMAMASGLALASLLTLLKSKLLKISNDKNKEKKE